MKKIVILGTHNSGSTLLAGLVHSLGINFGNRISMGGYGVSYEDAGIYSALRPFVAMGQPIDWEGLRGDSEKITTFIAGFFETWRPIPTGIKHPFLCAGLTVVGDEHLKEFTFLNCSRPISESVAGAQDSYSQPPDKVAAYQLELFDAKLEVLRRATALGCPIMDWNYNSMMTESRQVIRDLASFLDRKADDEYIDAVIKRYSTRPFRFSGLPIPLPPQG